MASNAIYSFCVNDVKNSVTKKMSICILVKITKESCIEKFKCL